ncbi:hypothetical protein NA57DRAFT_55152 [Rhizodiscina lignyota]|uniref:C3H1-type domain-containing protein n=1 Tax=Rhizodiscina lignyota TaxID=1504668 RepID=A0A9P4IKN0_9PEZI|nr:hypothetical protein NA57DRAFT_55152 [Rhizodiscina lignyota]
MAAASPSSGASSRRAGKIHLYGSTPPPVDTVWKAIESCDVEIYLLDYYLEEIGIRETTFRVDRNTISPHSIVILDPLSKVDEVKSFISGLNIPVHTYECPTQRENAFSKDLVIIPSFVWRMAHSDLVDLFQDSKAKSAASGLNATTYFQYRQHFFWDSRTDELAISNRFAELPDPELPGTGDRSRKSNGDGILGDNHDEVTDTTDGFTQVNHRSEQQKKIFQKGERKWRRHCYWGFYCRDGIDCKHGRTREEQERFETFGRKIPKKHELCPRERCMHGPNCPFAHGEKDLLCTACDSRGHHRTICPMQS